MIIILPNGQRIVIPPPPIPEDCPGEGCPGIPDDCPGCPGEDCPPGVPDCPGDCPGRGCPGDVPDCPDDCPGNIPKGCPGEDCPGFIPDNTDNIGGAIRAAPSRDSEKTISLIDALVKKGMPKRKARELANQIIQDIKQRKLGEEREKLIRLIIGNPSPSKQGKLATTWGKVKTKY